MSRRKSRKRRPETAPSNGSPSPMRAYLEALQLQRERIWQCRESWMSEWSEGKKTSFEMAVNDREVEADVAQFRGLALTRAKLLPPDMGESWTHRLGCISTLHGEFLRAANELVVLVTRFADSSSFLLTNLMQKSPNPPRELLTVAQELYERNDELRKQITEALHEWIAVEENPKIAILPPVLDVKEGRVFVNGEATPLNMTVSRAEDAMRFLTELIAAGGDWISAAEINSKVDKKPNGTSRVRWDRVFKELPEPIKRHIQASRGRGYRLKPNGRM